MFVQKLLPALATSTVCSQATAVVNSAADASALANCATIAGSIVIGPSATGIISIDGPEQIGGDLTCSDAGGLVSLGSTTIASIGGSFALSNLTLLSTLNMASLKSVQIINWSALPALSQLSFTAVVSKATSVTITNTFLSTLNGINLETVSVLDINNNNHLKTFSTRVANVTSLLSISNASSIEIPSLAVVNGSMGLYGNYITSLSALNLTTVGYTDSNLRQGSLAIVANS
ncbi:hypothetical protein BJ875DRAFT_507918 [Amylocarpus encephaloides]|uniref:Uncharacterized protein n=1 Tax=Amylocarpus encephaloides TaxID=45428 RepID=A0A9P7YA76_9HELO|nr:hypothetical protein BJ875DRAFT_507918 [Amylocarpus encephaloides]